MKKSILIIVTALVSVSCEEYIDLSKTGPERMLVVNGNLVAGDTLHTVYLTWSRYTDVSPVKTARLDCYINGKLAASTDKVYEPNRFAFDAGAMSFKTKFAEGDEVRISINADEAHVEAMAVAPKAPVISAVDTSSFRANNKKGRSTDYYMAKVNVKDIAGEKNYYRILIYYDSDFRVGNTVPGGDYTEGQFLCSVSKDIEFDNTYESLLYKNVNFGMDGNSSSEDNYYANKYNLFTDNTFADDEYTLKLALKKTLLNNDYPDSWYGDDYVPVEYGRIRFRVLSLSRSTYTYMNDYMFDESDQSLWTFITPIPYPSNVKGGTGLISVMTPADFVIEHRKG